MDADHPPVGTAPPPEDEEGRGEAEQSRRCSADDVAEPRRLVHAEGVQEEGPEHGHRDRQDDSEGDR